MIGTTKRLLLSLGCLLGVMFTGCLAELPGIEANSRDEAAPPPEAPKGKPARRTIAFDKTDYELTGPFTQGNLAVYLVHAKADERKDQVFITLDEGLRSGKVSVTEKKGGGSVQELVIDNRSDYPLYLQEGDRLSGGQQDRTVQTPLVIGPKSGPQKLPTFCIEQNRWRQSNPENRFEAGASIASAPKEVRLAAKFRSDQGDVWRSVEAKKAEYSMAFSAANTNSSLNESLDDKAVRQAAQRYAQPLANLVSAERDVVGVAFAVDGKIEEVNIYGGHPLLAKMYPRLLESYAMAAAAKAAPNREEKPASAPAAKGKARAPAADPDSRAAALLRKPMHTRFNGMAFDKVLEDLETITGVPFAIDWDSIEKAGIKRDKRIVVRVRNTPGDDVLRQVLQFAGGRDADALSYTIADGKIHVSDRHNVGVFAARSIKGKDYVTAPPEKTFDQPTLDAIAQFMEHGGAAKTTDRVIDAANRLEVVELSDRFFSRSKVGDHVVHRQWIRSEKEAAK